jgi:hypothetical protein
MNSSVGRKVVVLTGISLAMLLTACKDKRIKAVQTGITRDSLLTVIGKGAPGVDSIPNVYRTERYLIDGKNYEIFYFSGEGEHLNGATKDTIPWKKLTPIAMVDRVVAGKDWPFLDSLYGAHKIPLHAHE